MQTKRQSLHETVVSTIVGLVFSYFVQAALVWAYNVQMTQSQNAQFVVWFTLASLFRGYWIRRYFNWKHRVNP